MRCILAMVATSGLSTICSANDAKAPDKPPPPASTVPALQDVSFVGFCIGCDEPFSPPVHDKLIKEVAAVSPYVGELRRALYWQDTIHQFESKAHFDNCDFEGSMAYVDGLMAEVGTHVTSAAKAKAKGDTAGATAKIKEAFFSLGQALHAVQDFYAHTNYVELSAASAKRIEDLKVIAPWQKEGRDAVLAMARQGLFSGFVFWGAPQKCPSGTLSHGAIAKDKPTTASGKIKVAHLRNHSQYQLAEMLARAASEALLTDAFRRWPLLAELNGSVVAVEVFVDRRGLDENK